MTSQIGRRKIGATLFYFCVAILFLSSTFKFIHPPSAVSYMKSLGYEGTTFALIAVMELAIAILLALRNTRLIGLLLASSYLGGAVAAHLAYHKDIVGGPGVVYLIGHPAVGVLAPALVLFAGWAGALLQHPELLSTFALNNSSLSRAACAEWSESMIGSRSPRESGAT